MKLVVDLTWTLRAACRTVPPETFFPTKQACDRPEVKLPVSICLDCPVRQDCLDYAMALEGTETTYRFGIYGGLTPRQRNHLTRTAHRDLSSDVKQLARTAPAPDVRAWANANNVIVPIKGAIHSRIRLAYATAVLEEQATA